MIPRLIQFCVSCLPWGLRRRIHRIPIIAPIQRWVIRHWMPDSSFVCKLNAGPATGLLYPVQLPSDKAIWIGTYESKLSEAISRSITKGAICFDIGGYRGFFSGLMALSGAGAVHVFEPFPENCAQIERVLHMNSDLPIQLHNMAVGEMIGEAQFSILPEASMGKLNASPFESGNSPERHITVKVSTLDFMVSKGQLEPPSVIKIDVEGAEGMVLRGALETLKNHHPILFIEAHSRELCRECFEFLLDLGYKVVVLETGKQPDFKSEPELCHLIAQS